MKDDASVKQTTVDLVDWLRNSSSQEWCDRYERGIVHRTIGAAPDIEYLDAAEASEYMRGYNDD